MAGFLKRLFGGSQSRTLPPAPESPYKPTVSPEDQIIRLEWLQSEVFFAGRMPTEEAAKHIADLSADDLHVVARSLSSMAAVGTVLALAQHPRLDRGTALELLFGFSAASYQSGFRDGTDESAWPDAEDQTLFRAFEVIEQRARSGDFASARFANRMHKAWEGRMTPTTQAEDPSYPTNWIKWALPPEAMAPTNNETPVSNLDGSDNCIRLSFEVWNAARLTPPR